MNSSVVELIPNPHPEVIGKTVRMKFNTSSSRREWFEGIVASYNSIDGKYGIYFPCDGQTVNASFDDEDLEFL